jgi:hypothetical protein
MGTIMALRNEILKPGGYASVPHRVLESSKLATSDKIVYQVLLDYLGGNDSVWPSQATIARRTALSIRSVRRSVARLTEVGLISCEVIAGTSNHYTFSAPEAVLNTTAGADSVSDVSQPGGGQADRINPDTLSVPPATLAGLSGHADRINPDTLSHDPLHLTTSLEPRQGNKSDEPPHSPACGGQQPVAAESVANTQPDLVQGVQDMEPDSHPLLVSWMQQKRPLPSPDKIKVCLKLLQIQQERTGETLDPDVILEVVGDDFQFADLFKRGASGRYRWQELQARDPNRKAKSSRQKVQPAKHGSEEQAERIYQEYPRKIARAAAFKAIKAAIKRMQERDKNEDAVAFLLERTRLFAASPAGNRGRFTPHASTWFNRESYLDDEQEWGVANDISGNIKRVITEEQPEQSGMTDEEFAAYLKGETK